MKYADDVMFWILDLAVKTCPRFLAGAAHNLQTSAKASGFGYRHQGFYVLCFYLAFALLLLVACVGIRRFMRSTPME